MRPFEKQQPWYAAGLAFECLKCGKCCTGPEEGYVWVGLPDIVAIAAFLGLSAEEVHRRYVRKVFNRYSLIECPRSNDCVFLQPDGLRTGGCAIYPVRPVQCRTWPFWDRNLRCPEDWTAAQGRCKGINRGPLYGLADIEAKRTATVER